MSDRRGDGPEAAHLYSYQNSSLQCTFFKLDLILDGDGDGDVCYIQITMGLDFNGEDHRISELKGIFPRIDRIFSTATLKRYFRAG